MFKCSVRCDSVDYEEDEDAVVIRVFGEHGISQNFHRDSEVDLMCLAAEKGVIPPIFCRYCNLPCQALDQINILFQNKHYRENIYKVLTSLVV